MADRGHVLTDQMLSDLEDRIADEYAIANRDMQKKLIEYLEKTEEARKKQKALLDAGKITQKDYDDWVFRHTMMGKQWEQMRDVLAQDLENANEIALKIARGEMPDVYALNANYGTYMIEHGAGIDTGFTLYNHDAAELLMKKQDLQLMPGPSTKKAAEIAADKSMQWNRQKIQSAVLQGILQGESAYEVAKRLRSVATMNYNASVRYARTMTTDAQNAGRYESFRRAKRLGVDLTIEWAATLDGRTRHEHRMMHGQRREVDEPFEVSGFKIMWPAQSHGPGSSDIPQSMIWNCRCTLLAWVKGFEGDTVKSSPKMGDMSFEEWKGVKEQKQTTQKDDLTERRKSRLKEYRLRHRSPDFDTMNRNDLINYASDNFASQIVFKGADEDAVRGTVKAVDRFEKAGGKIGSTRIVFGGTQGNYGFYDPKTDTLHLRANSNFVEKMEKENESALFKLHRVQWIDPTYEGLCAHELGHAFDRYFGQDISREISRSRSLLADAFRISNYAATEPAIGSPRASEAVAENMAAYLAGEEKRNLIAPDILKILEKYLHM